MASGKHFASIPDSVKERVKKFRFKKKGKDEDEGTDALILKINLKEDVVEVEEEFENSTPDDIRDGICEHEPRYIVVSYKYAQDGRVTYPLVFIYSTPEACASPSLPMKYAGLKTELQNTLGFTKVFEIRDLDEDNFNEEWLNEKAKTFF